jgi:hypothetical protein
MDLTDDSFLFKLVEAVLGKPLFKVASILVWKLRLKKDAENFAQIKWEFQFF